jgi:hypothetical protein
MTASVPRGAPSLIFGRRPDNMPAPDAFIAVDDLVAATTVPVATALACLHAGAGG